MEEASFRSRLDRTFGFLNDANRNGGDSHLWSVEGRAASSMMSQGLSRAEDNSDDDDDDEVSGYADFLKSEKRAKERSNSSFFGEDDLEELESGDEEEDGDEDEDEEEQMRLGKKKKSGAEQQTDVKEVNRASEGGNGPLDPPIDDDEERQVREMMGMDCTLDFEDEEDEYDKVAAGTEGTDDRLFMSQVRNFGTSRQQLNPLPTSFIEMRQASRDRRADQKAALARLEEDDRLAAAKESSHTVKSNSAEDQPVRQDNGGEAMDIDGDHGHKEEPMEEVKNETLNPESSLVRDGKQRKTSKRVRFSLENKSDAAASLVVAVYPIPDVQSTPNRYSKVPDYVKNPSKYLHYTLDWEEEDEEQANLAAFHATRVVSSSSSQDMVAEEALQDPNGSTKISFNPHVAASKRSVKESSSKGMGAEGGVSNGVVNVAANFDMDLSLEGPMTIEDEQDSSTSSGLIGQGKSGRVVRRYRNRVTDDVD